MTYRSGHKEIEQLVTLGKERGYLTFEEVNDALPPDVLSADQIDDMMNVLRELDIEVVESADKAKKNQARKDSEKPMRIEEFKPEKAWWEKRNESEFAWKVSAKEVVDRGYNLDIKNPNAVDEGRGDPDELLKQYAAASDDAAKIRNKLKSIITETLGAN